MESGNPSSAPLDVLETVSPSAFKIEGMEFQQSDGITENRRPRQLPFFSRKSSPFGQNIRAAVVVPEHAADPPDNE